MMLKPKILFLVPETYSALKAKGIKHMILERDEDGFFEKVITVHPLTNKTQKLTLSAEHILYEFNLRSFLYPNKMGLLLPFFPVRFCFMMMQLFRLVKKEKINIIRANDPYLMGFIAWLLSFFTNIPFCVSIHSDYKLVFALNPRTGFKKFLRICSSWLPKFILPKAQLVMPISNYLRKRITENVIPENIRVLPHGINFNDNCEMPSIRDLFGLPSDKKIISFVGRLTKEKYIEDALQLMEKLNFIRDDVILVIAGNGEMRDQIIDWLTIHPELALRIFLLGFQPNQICRALQKEAQINLCFLSGFSLIEACASARPVIAYNVEWQNELIENNVTGILIKEHDLESLVNSVCYLLDHPNESEIMGQQAKLKAFQYHNIEITSRIKQNYYLELLKEQRAVKLI